VESLMNAQQAGDGAARAVPSGWEADTGRRLRAKDEAALGEVYDQYASFVYGLALRVIGEQRGAEDVSQEVFV
jgi:RNA polymerase sigma-70 factor, ECF subfamily